MGGNCWLAIWCDERSLLASFLNRTLEQVACSKEPASMHEEVAGDDAGFAVNQSAFPFVESLKGPDSRSGLLMDGDHSLLVRFSRRDAKSWRAIWIAVETVNFEPTDFPSSSSAPASNEQGRLLIRTVKRPNRAHEPFQFLLRNIARNPQRALGKIAREKKWSHGNILPSPAGDLAKELSHFCQSLTFAR